MVFSVPIHDPHTKSNGNQTTYTQPRPNILSIHAVPSPHLTRALLMWQNQIKVPKASLTSATAPTKNHRRVETESMHLFDGDRHN